LPPPVFWSRPMLLIPEKQVREIIGRVLLKRGLTTEEAAIVSDILTEAELRGRPTHGLMRLPGIAKASHEAAGIRSESVIDRGACACIDAKHQLGYLACHRGAAEAIVRAREHGLALVGVRNTRHMGMLGYYVDMIARQGIVGLAFADCIPLVAPHGGIDKVLGTNPIAAAFPWEPHPIVIDLATSATTLGEIMIAQHKGERIREGQVIDREGHPTTDPAEAREGALLPMAGHKGYALALMAQLLSGALTGAVGLPLRYEDYGALFIAVQPDVLGSAAQYRAEVEKVVRAIKSSRRAEGFDEILIPGERAYREREQRKREGISVEDALWRELQSLIEN